MPMNKIPIPGTKKSVTLNPKGPLKPVVDRQKKLDEAAEDPDWNGPSEGPIDWGKKKQR